MNYAIIYFSGTGNTRYLAHRLLHKIQKGQAICANITKPLDFESIISCSDFIFFCYPVYGSTAPMIMEEFVLKYKNLISGKKVGVLITQGGMSGDGASYLGRLLKKLGADVVCLEHFDMPDNICDTKKQEITEEEIAKYLNKAGKKLDVFMDNFEKGKYTKRGSLVFSRMLGSVQRVPWKVFYPKIQARLKIDRSRCIGCGKCVKLCPTSNLFVKDNKAGKYDRCTLCYRCINACPKKAISLLGNKTSVQYKGLWERK